MALNYTYPGVYVQEVPSGFHPIQAVGTSTAAFIGEAPLDSAPVNEPTPIDNWSQFLSTFVGQDEQGRYLPSTNLSHAVYGFFINGGGRCFVVNVGKGNPIQPALAALEAIDEVAIVAATGYVGAANYDAVLTHCETLKDRVAILDAPLDATVQSMTKVGTTARRERGKEGGNGNGDRADRARRSPGGYGAQYYPGIITADPLRPGPDRVNVFPSGHIAGIYARTDGTRGVHKAPANEIVRGALSPIVRVTDQDQGVLNPLGVNCIRFFSTQGVVLWGVRTLDDPAGDWRYVNVRRLVNMIEESIQEGTSWVVFEPNDQILWGSITRDIGDFLTRLWRDGALVGATPEQAFYVRCDAETNPPDVVSAGIVVTEIGVAPVKPAEFVVFRISQSAGGFQVEGA